jgi:DNA polymerase
VVGEGNARALLVFVGEGPGEEEDAQGRPFVGPAGQLLTKIIQAMGLRREEVYIANVVKCRPPANRTPKPEEVSVCKPFLLRQLRAISPKVICALGGVSAQALLESGEGISRLRGRFHRWDGIPVMPTFHPSYLLRNPERKRAVWEDMKQVMELLKGER